MNQKDETPFKYDAKEKGNNAYSRQQEEKERKKKEEQEKEDRKKLFGCTFEISI